MQDTVSTTITLLQYADDTIFYDYAKIDELQNCADIVLEPLSEIKSWSKNNNLAFIKKTKLFLFSASRLSSYHHLDENEIIDNFSTCNKIERVKRRKLLEVKFDQYLKFEKHFTKF